MDVRDLKVFPLVAKVLGEASAINELSKVWEVVKGESSLDISNFKESSILMGAFLWHKTPQGPSFWRDVSDASEETLVSDEVTMEDMKNIACYQQVAYVLGKDLAAYELYEVYKVLPQSIRHKFRKNKELNMAFTWNRTPQGYAFWMKISAYKNPNKIDFGF